MRLHGAPLASTASLKRGRDVVKRPYLQWSVHRRLEVLPESSEVVRVSGGVCRERRGVYRERCGVYTESRGVYRESRETTVESAELMGVSCCEMMTSGEELAERGLKQARGRLDAAPGLGLGGGGAGQGYGRRRRWGNRRAKRSLLLGGLLQDSRPLHATRGIPDGLQRRVIPQQIVHNRIQTR